MCSYIVTFAYRQDDTYNPRSVSVIVHSSLDNAPEAAKQILRTQPNSFKLNGPYSRFASESLSVEEMEKYVFPNLVGVEMFNGVISFSALDG